MPEVWTMTPPDAKALAESSKHEEGKGMSDNPIRNTTATATFLDSLPGAIEASERAGTRQLAAQSERLPVDGSDNPALAAMGLVFGDPIPDDPIWRAVRLPTGWKIVTTDHSMWCNVVDESDTVRALVFYKAAFYDRHCFIRPAPCPT
jgi:hypothetical protein